MKLLLPFPTSVLPLASVAQSQSPSGVPSVPIPKSAEVLVMLTPKQGVTAQQVMVVMPSEIGGGPVQQ